MPSIGSADERDSWLGELGCQDVRECPSCHGDGGSEDAEAPRGWRRCDLCLGGGKVDIGRWSAATLAEYDFEGELEDRALAGDEDALAWLAEHEADHIEDAAELGSSHYVELCDALARYRRRLELRAESEHVAALAPVANARLRLAVGAGIEEAS